MPIYEYRCECGAVLESLDRIGAPREFCGELCSLNPKAPDANLAPDATVASPVGAAPARGCGRLQRLFSAPGIRGDGREAREPTFDPVKRAARPGCDCSYG